MAKKPPIKAILHDWDDTIVLTYQSVFPLFHRFAKRHKLPIVTDDDIRSHWGLPVPRILSGLWPDQNIDYLLQTFNASVPKDFTTPPVNGVAKTYEKLGNAGIMLGIISSTPKEAINRLLKLHPFLISPWHVYVQAAEDHPVHKPDPSVFDPAFQKLAGLNIHEEDTLYVGDGLNDLKAAKNRGLQFIAVTTGFSTKEDFISLGLSPDQILDNFTQLPKLVEETS